MTNLSRHLILKQCHEVCEAIEECGASEELTEASMKACALLEELNSLVDNDERLGNLLAIVHRDGGHYTEKHGVEKSYEDAKEKVSNMIHNEI